MSKAPEPVDSEASTVILIRSIPRCGNSLLPVGICHCHADYLPDAEFVVSVFHWLAAGEFATAYPHDDYFAADLVPVVSLESLAHACRCLGQVYCLGLVAALLAQLLHVDGIAAPAQAQRLALRGHRFASAFGADADYPAGARPAVNLGRASMVPRPVGCRSIGMVRW